MLESRQAAHRTLRFVVLVLGTTSGCRRTDAPEGPTRATPTVPSASAAARAPIASPPGAALEVPAAQAYRPATAPGERRPLVVFLHGLGSSGRQMFDAFSLAEFGRSERAHVLAPDGTLDAAGRRFWNAGSACCNFDQRPVDDVARFASAFQAWSAEPGVDPRALYVIGYSNGGFMAHRLACVLDVLAGIASLAGAVAEDMPACKPRANVSVLEIHGDRDKLVRYGGGSVFDDPRIGRHLSATEGLEAWGRWLGCSGSAEASARLDLVPQLPGDETEVLRHPSCARGSAELWTVRGAGHSVAAPDVLLARIWARLSPARRH